MLFRLRLSGPAWLWAFALGVATLSAGCAQKEGERCEVNSDCEDGLQCTGGTGTDKTCTDPDKRMNMPPPMDAGAEMARPDAAAAEVSGEAPGVAAGPESAPASPDTQPDRMDAAPDAGAVDSPGAG